jgi:hypothetical protein
MVPAHAVPVPSSRGMQATARAKQTLLWAGTRQQIADGHSRVVGLYRFNFLRASNIDHCGGVRDGRLPLPIGRSMEYEASSIRWSETSEATGNGPCRWATRKRNVRGFIVSAGEHERYIITRRAGAYHPRISRTMSNN